MADSLPRKLTAVFYADVVGYSRLTGKEKDTIAPGLSVLNWVGGYRSKSHERLKENLLAAGLPE